jgi:hypothetical protein
MSLPLAELVAAKPVYEWLETHWYSIKQRPSNNDKMVQIGALCFSSEFIYREDFETSNHATPIWGILDPAKGSNHSSHYRGL